MTTESVNVAEHVEIRIWSPGEIVPRDVAYFYKDANLPEPYPVYDARATAWWMDGGVKLHELMAHFKKRHTVKQACYFTGITEDQYKHFRDLHRWFVPSIRIYKSLVPMAISDVILEAALGNKERGIQPNAKIALGAARLYPNTETDADFADLDSPVPLSIPPGGEKRTLIAEEIVNETGKVVMSRRAMELVKSHDNGND